MLDYKRLKILTESAKYDVSCSSSGSARKNTSVGIGNAAFSGICHSFTQDGRCISLLKILMSNDCAYDCQYCVNRRSNDIPRTTATPEEICDLVINFYKRNYIEGLFLSSAICNNPDDTMVMLVETVRKLRQEYRFNGYIHLKGIPSADPKLIMFAGELADRISFNIELPSEKSLKLLAPQKTKKSILLPMSNIAGEYKQARSMRYGKFLPAGQTTQMIVGASPESDGHIIRLTQSLYDKFSLKRVYFSSYVPTNYNNPNLPVTKVSLTREHRLYQADWLLRFYGFSAEEILGENENLAEDFDPKCGWALKHPEFFPVEINTAPAEKLVRVPGIGFKSAYKIVSARKYGNLSLEDLNKMRIVMKRAINFITCNGKFYGTENQSTVRHTLLITDSCALKQMSMFTDIDNAPAIYGGEI